MMIPLADERITERTIRVFEPHLARHEPHSEPAFWNRVVGIVQGGEPLPSMIEHGAVIPRENSVTSGICAEGQARVGEA